MINDAEHLSICIGHLYALLREASILCPFLIGLFDFLVLSFVSTLYIWDINLLSDVSMNMVPHSVGCVFILLMISFAMQKLFSLMWSHSFIFPFVSLAWGNTSDKKLLQAMSEILLPMFSLRILNFRSNI